MSATFERPPTVTKLHVAHRQLRMAIRMFLNDLDPVCVYTLACNARAIYEEHLRRRNRERMFDLISSVGRGEYTDDKELWSVLNDSRNFFKRPGDTLDDELEFTAEQNDLALLVACADCTEVCGDKRTPETAAYMLWITATHPELSRTSKPSTIAENEAYLREFDRKYPGLPNARREERKRFGRSLFLDECPVV